jgi:superfamily II DNA or RNA helicase
MKNQITPPVINYLQSQGFTKIGLFESDSGQTLSSLFFKTDTLIVIDHPLIFTEYFTYSRYCQVQNEWMSQYKTVFRWLEDDLNGLKMFLETSPEREIKKNRTFNRESLSESSFLEEFFEARFQEVYGSEAFKYIKKEYPLLMVNGEVGYLDFVLFHQNNSWLVIEENGVSYHHPLQIQKEQYQKILMKQNSVVLQNGRVIRWDSSSIGNAAKVCDEIREFIGDISQYKIQTTLKSNRSFELYEHQENTLSELRNQRARGLESSLVVLPTGTGKSRVAIEDMAQFESENPTRTNRFLILAPSIDLTKQWETNINTSLQSTHQIEIRSFAYICRHYQYLPKDQYDYILIDEAHHAMADVLLKAIQYFNPKFLLGLTATDERLDQKRLSDLFGTYETSLDLKEAIEQNLLSPIRVYRLKTNVDLSQVRFNGKDYVNADLEKKLVVDSRNHMIVNIIDQYFNPTILDQNQSFFSGLVFCVSVKHAEKMAKLLKEKGISAESVSGHDPNREKKIQLYQNKEIQFLCTCSLLTEGWDAPFTSVIIMARPTFSRSLYTQQIGRGTRKYPNKEALYVIDVVDQYGILKSSSMTPWSTHSIFQINTYRPPFDQILTQTTKNDPPFLTNVNLVETEVALEPIDIFTFEKLYDQTLSAEQLARELFISTSTIMNWIKKKEISADYELPIGRKSIYLFKKEQVETIRSSKNLKVHNETTIVEDFWDFIEERDYTFSYKIYFLLSFLDKVDLEGNLEIEKLYDCYQNYYTQRYIRGLKIEKKTSPYHQIEFLKNKEAMIQSILNNPYEKFERKRFMSYAQDLSLICMHHKIWAELNQSGKIEKLRNQLIEDLSNYEKRLEAEG